MVYCVIRGCMEMIRKQTTKELLGESVRELAAQRSLDKITVKEIAQNCGVTSATFYNHFRDKYDLIAWVLNEQMEQVYMAYAEGKETWPQTILSMIHVLYDGRSFYRNAFANTSGQNSFVFSTHSHSIDLLTEIVRQKAGAQFTDDLAFFVEFYLRGTSITVMEWILGGCKTPPEQLADYFMRAMPAPLQPYLA